MTLRMTTFLAGAVMAFVASEVCAQQSTRQHLHVMSFDLWCQENQNLPPKRCDKRLPQDDAAYQDYVNLMEHYETQQLNGESQDRRLERNILRSDPSADPAGTPPTQPVVPPR
jgi:hypothetical protein